MLLGTNCHRIEHQQENTDVTEEAGGGSTCIYVGRNRHVKVISTLACGFWLRLLRQFDESNVNQVLRFHELKGVVYCHLEG